MTGYKEFRSLKIRAVINTILYFGYFNTKSASHLHWAESNKDVKHHITSVSFTVSCSWPVKGDVLEREMLEVQLDENYTLSFTVLTIKSCQSLLVKVINILCHFFLVKKTINAFLYQSMTILTLFTNWCLSLNILHLSTWLSVTICFHFDGSPFRHYLAAYQVLPFFFICHDSN